MRETDLSKPVRGTAEIPRGHAVAQSETPHLLLQGLPGLASHEPYRGLHAREIRSTSVMKIHCLFDRMEAVADLRPHPKNRNQHPKKQIERLAKILKVQGWRHAIKISRRSGYITTGHGRLEAARHLKLKEVPVVFQDYDSDELEYADMTADNAIACWAELDLSGLNIDVPDLGPDFDLDLLGLEAFSIDPPGVESGEERPASRSKLLHRCPGCGMEFGADPQK